MKEMQIQGIDLNIQNLQKEITQLKGTKTAKADTGHPSCRQAQMENNSQLYRR